MPCWGPGAQAPQGVVGAPSAAMAVPSRRRRPRVRNPRMTRPPRLRRLAEPRGMRQKNSPFLKKEAAIHLYLRVKGDLLKVLLCVRPNISL